MFKKHEIDQRFKDFMITEIPPGLINKKPGQGDLRYISGYSVIDMLNNLTNYMWEWSIDKCWIEKCVDKYNPKYDTEPKPQNPVAHVIGTLTMHFQDENGNDFVIRKSAPGAKPLIGGQNEQKDIFKSASTDAIKKAASYFGIGAQLYRKGEEQEYFMSLNYEDPWTQEEEEAHKEEFDYIKHLMTGENGLSREEINEAVLLWSKEQYVDINDLLPDELTSFVEYIKGQQDEEVAK